MNLTAIIILIVVPILALLIMSFLLFKFSEFQLEIEHIEKGVTIFQFDLYSRNVKKVKMKYSKDFTRSLKRRYSQWKPIKNVFHEIGLEENDIKKINLLFQDLETKKEYKKIEFCLEPSNHKKKIISNYSMYFYPNAENSDFTLSIKWSIKKKDSKIKHFNSNGKINHKQKYSCFIALNLTNKKRESIISFTKKLHIQKSNMSIKILDNLFLIHFKEKTFKKADRNIEKIKNYFLKSNQRIFFDSLYKGSATLIQKDINTNKQILNAIKVLKYIISISISKNTELLSHNNKNINFIYLKEYSKNYSNFNHALKISNISTYEINVKNYESSKKITSYGIPIVNDVDQKYLRVILKNPYEKRRLVSAHIKKLNSNENKVKGSIIVDINLSDILNLELTNRDITYSIDSNQEHGFILGKEKIKELSMEGFHFALRVRKFNHLIGILINQIQPKFLIIAKDTWDSIKDKKDRIYNDLIVLKNITDLSNIKIIYEDPFDRGIENFKPKNVGLKYYYNFKKD